MAGAGALSALERAVFVPSQSTPPFRAAGNGGGGFTVVVISFRP
jgi:hypothetical protein